MASQHLTPLPLSQANLPGLQILPPPPPPKGLEATAPLGTGPNTAVGQIDKQFVDSFLSGESCLSGGVRSGSAGGVGGGGRMFHDATAFHLREAAGGNIRCALG